MAISRPGLLVWMGAAFAVVAVAFIAGTLIAQHEASKIDVGMSSLQSNELPSVDRMLAARTALRRLETSSEQLSFEPAGSDLTDDVAAARRARQDLDRQVNAYLDLQSNPEVRRTFEAEVRPPVGDLDAAITHMVAVARAGGSHELRWRAYKTVDDDIDSVDDGLVSLIRLNAGSARDVAEHVVATRQQSVRLAAVLDGAAALVAVIAAALAIGAARRYGLLQEESARQLKAKFDELDTYALRVAHDMLSPLSAVGLSLEMLARQTDDASTRRIVARAQRSLVRSRAVASAIYAFARSGAAPTPGQLSPLRPTIDAAVEELLEKEEGPPPEVIVEPFEDCSVACDTGVLQSMLSNVLSNAAKFSLESPQRRITIRARAVADRVRVEVEDTGPGIPAGLKSAIFEPYVRAPGVVQPGLGLGLATVKRYATAHGGRVGAQRGKLGAVVWFELPRAPEPPWAEPRAEALEEAGQAPSVH
jgi:signal transduction histidine kinase